MLTIEDIQVAAERIAPHIVSTPVMTSSSINVLVGGDVFFKCENFQRVGAFKARGAANAVFALSDADAAKGVATHSSGNHGAALARAAALRGVPCHVVVPVGANPVKRAAIVRYGANVIDCEATMAGRESALAGIVAETGSRIVHPYADRDVMAGQGTVALELLETHPKLDLLLVPLGGGGLLGGCAIAARTLAPGIRIVGVEPAGAADARASFHAGEVRPVEHPETLADGLRATIGEPNLQVIREYVDDILTVPDDALVSAMRLIWERLKIVVEPSAAVGLAAAMTGAEKLAGRQAGIILTGGNADLDQLPWL